MRRHRQTGLTRHGTDPQGTVDAAKIENIGLDDIDSTHIDHPPPCRQITILLATGDINIKGVGHLFVCSSSQ